MYNENSVIEFALTKMLNSGLINEDYPMIKEIIVGDVNIDKRSIQLKIIIDDLSITAENMYEKMFDPHYLCDIRVPNLISYLGFPSTNFINNSFFVYNTDGKFIVGFLSKKTGVGGYYYPDENGKPYKKSSI